MLFAFFAVAAVAFVPPHGRVKPALVAHSAVAPRLTAHPQSTAYDGASLVALPEPLPHFSWRTVVFFALNPAVFMPLPLLAVGVFKFNVAGVNWAVNAAAVKLGLLFTAPVVALSLLPLDRIPGFESMREVTRASETICLYAFGARLVPLRASAGALLLAASAAVFEELAFRGTLMGGIEALAGRVMPPRTAALFALAAQAG